MQSAKNVAVQRPVEERDGGIDAELKASLAKFETLGDGKPGKAELLKELETLFRAAFLAGDEILEPSIVVDLKTFNYVQGQNRTAALRAFVAHFGRDASGWAFDIAGPVKVGGGACPR